MDIRLRPIRLPVDYEPVAELFNLIQPGSASPAEMEAEDRHIPATANLYKVENGLLGGYGRERLVAEDATGRVIGYGAVWRAPWAPPGSVGSFFCVHPDFRRQGIGSALLARIEDWAQSNGASVFMSELKDWIPESIPFVQKRGFVLDAHVFALTLDLSTFDEAPFTGTVDALKESGIRFITLADLPGELTERKLYDLYRETVVDNPGQVGGHRLGFDQWREEALPESRTRPDWVFLAVHGDHVVGVTTLFSTDDPGVIYTDYTGVVRAYRGRRISLALKLLSVATARQMGAHTMLTETEAKNGPMQAVNGAMGYVPGGQGVYRIIKHLS